MMLRLPSLPKFLPNEIGLVNAIRKAIMIIMISQSLVTCLASCTSDALILSAISRLFEHFSYQARILYIPEAGPPSTTTSGRQPTTMSIPGVSRFHPYARSTTSSAHSTSLALGSVMSPEDAESITCVSESSLQVAKINYKDYDQVQQAAITWACRRFVMTSVTTTGWKRNITPTEKKEMVRHLAQVADDVMDGYDFKPTDDNLSAEDRQVFMEAHRIILYNTSPLCDPDMLRELSTTTLEMLSATATGIMFSIDRAVTAGLPERVVRFSTIPYADQQDAIFNGMKLALASEVHKVSFTARLLDLHRRGLKALDDFLGLSPPAQSIYIPMMMAELRIPLEAAPQHHNVIVPYTDLSHSQTLGPLYSQPAEGSSTALGLVADLEESEHEQISRAVDDMLNWESSNNLAAGPSDQSSIWKQGSYTI
ncbi:hypothetical protein EV702DRAFT_1044224 [Suillus placidus]|uniref:Uncharacterized protein n=1 Tax=Suillus placidus TaxID=48579 RepID=A0A9P6ZZN6_9AGAM|nr:hypothetical protein EV702DRAFT_1044224 [Suillus placidus]